MKKIMILVVLTAVSLIGCKKHVNASCSDSPKSLNLIKVKGFSVTCPANCGSASTWGSDLYTADSSLCQAAIHAGVIQKDKGGKFSVNMAPGQSSYKGSEKNGVTTLDWNTPWEASFSVK